MKPASPGTICEVCLAPADWEEDGIVAPALVDHVFLWVCQADQEDLGTFDVDHRIFIPVKWNYEPE